MADEAHGVAVDFARRVLGGEPTRVWIATRTANAVARHAIGLGSLVMAARAAHDVVPSGRAMEARAPERKPSGGVRIIRVLRNGRQSLVGVTIRAIAGGVACLAARLVCLRVD